MTFFRRVADRGRDRGDQGRERRDERRYRYVARFSGTDAMLLRELVSQVAELVRGPATAGQPDDEPGAREDAPGPAVPGSAAPGLEAPGLEAPGLEAPGLEAPGLEASGLEALGLDPLGLTEDAGLPEDPALARLLPDAYRDDPDASSEFRRYTEKDLRAGKVAAAKTVLDTLPAGGGRISLSETEAQVWLRALNDIRLALGVRLGVTEDVAAEMAWMSSDDPRFGVLAVYDWLSGTQESLVRALS